MKIKWSETWSAVRRGIAVLLGSVLFSAAINCFTAPNRIAPGGLTGIATVIHSLAPVPIGASVLVMNLPLFVWGAVQMGWRFTGRTAVATVLSSVLIDALSPVLPQYTENILLSAVFGGVCCGFGLALILNSGATTGGTDLAAKLVSRRLRHIPVGRLLFLFDLAVVAFAALVFREMESALYATITIFVTSRVMDELLYGLGSGNGKMMLIVTRKGAEIAAGILKELERGVTVLPSYGAYTQTENVTLLCALRRNEIYRVRDIVKREDANAFLVISTAEQIVGESFAPIQGEE